MSSDLKPCPFCGSRPRPVAVSFVADGKEYFSVDCSSIDCEAQIRSQPTEAEAVSAWNRRADSAVPSSHVSETDEPLKSKDHVSERPSVDRCVWRPMDTAPRDQTFILAYWPRHPYDEDDDLDESVDLGGVLAVTCSNGDGWIEPDYLDAIGRSFDDDDAYAPEPTLWTPLPPSPPAAVHHEAPEPNLPESSIAVLREALARCVELFDKALPKFNWGASCLDAEAITLLNEVPEAARSALAGIPLNASGDPTERSG